MKSKKAMQDINVKDKFAIASDIPTIDLSPIYQDSGLSSQENHYKQLGHQIREIYSQIGFCYLVNHNISHELIDQVFAMSQLFFDLPEATKMLIKQDHGFRGYIPLNSATTKLSTLGQYTTLPNHNEAFVIVESQQLEELRGKYLKFDLLGENKWLNDAQLFAQHQQFKAIILEYYAQLQQLVQTMLKIFAYAFEVPLLELMSYFEHPTEVLRLTNYPPTSQSYMQQTNQQQFGFAPHTDLGFFALLQQDQVGGLQVQNQQKQWISVAPIPYAFVLNASDTMKFMTDGAIIATPHRVICQECYRKSVALFVDPTLNKEIQVLSSFRDKASTKTSSKSFIYSDYALGSANKNYANSK